MGNTFKTALLLGTLSGLLILIGDYFAGEQGMIIAFLFAGGMNFFSYWFSDKMVLKMYRAREVGPEEAPELTAIVRELVGRAKLPMPRIYIIPSPQPNAFATGRDPNHAAVACTEGILRLMDRQDLMGVLGHELGHVKNRDILTSSVAATLAAAITMLARMAGWAAMFGGYGQGRDRRGTNMLSMIALMILAPFAALVIQMAISRSREYAADRAGAELCGHPLWLASALGKLEAGSERIPMANAEPTTAHMFIVNPLAGKGGIASLFRTHPPTEERIARLQAMAQAGRF